MTHDLHEPDVLDILAGFGPVSPSAIAHQGGGHRPPPRPGHDLVYSFQDRGILPWVAWLLSNLLEEAIGRGVDLQDVRGFEADAAQFGPWRRRTQRWAFLLYWQVLAERNAPSMTWVPMRSPVWKGRAPPPNLSGLPPARGLVPDAEVVAALRILARLPRLNGYALAVLRWSDIHITWRMAYINNPFTGQNTPFLTPLRKEALATLLGRSLPDDPTFPIDPNSTFLPLFRDMGHLPSPASSRRPRAQRS